MLLGTSGERRSRLRQFSVRGLRVQRSKRGLLLQPKWILGRDLREHRKRGVRERMLVSRLSLRLETARCLCKTKLHIQRSVVRL